MMDPAAYPHRRVTLAPQKADAASWSVFFMDEDGEPDLEAVSRLQEAIEAQSHILLCARTQGGLDSIAEVLDRMLGELMGATVH